MSGSTESFFIDETHISPRLLFQDAANKIQSFKALQLCKLAILLMMVIGGNELNRKQLVVTLILLFSYCSAHALILRIKI